MNKKKRDGFLKVINATAPEISDLDVANLVMQQIAAIEQEEMAIDASLKKLLVKHGADSAPYNLTRNVMSQITPTVNNELIKPIISTKVWRIAAAVILLPLLVLSFFSKENQNTTAGNLAHNLIVRVESLPSLYITIFILAGILMIADRMLTHKFNNNGRPEPS